MPKFGYLNVDLRLFDDTLETRRRVEFYVDGVRQTQLNSIKVIPGQRNLTLVAGMFRVTRSVKIQPGNFYTIIQVTFLGSETKTDPYAYLVRWILRRSGSWGYCYKCPASSTLFCVTLHFALECARPLLSSPWDWLSEQDNRIQRLQHQN